MSASQPADGSVPTRYRVVLRRRNGRYVREYPAPSKYAAKKLRDWLESEYDSAYYAEIKPAGKANDNAAATDT